MNDRKNGTPARAGGFFIALLAIGGVFIGGFMGQPSIGLLAGVALGVAIAVALWWKERGGG